MDNKKVNLIYKLEGNLTDRGIDIFELSPLLMSIGKLIQDSNDIVQPSGEKISVNVKPFQRGSFIIELALSASNNLQQLMSYVNSDNVKQIKEVLEWIGLIGGGTAGVIGIYKFLKGPPKKIEPKGDEVKITDQNDNSITVNKKTFALFQDNNIQQNIYNIYGNFLGKEGINSVKSYIKEEPEKTETKVVKDEVPYFNPANAILDEVKDDKKNITQCFLKPKRLSVEGEPDNWSFRKGGDTVITATIKDQDFLDKIKSGEIRLTKEDLLEVNLLEIQEVHGEEIYAKYEVLNVLHYKPSPVQSRLI